MYTRDLSTPYLWFSEYLKKLFYIIRASSTIDLDDFKKCEQELKNLDKNMNWDDISQLEDEIYSLLPVKKILSDGHDVTGLFLKIDYEMERKTAITSEIEMECKKGITFEAERKIIINSKYPVIISERIYDYIDKNVKNAKNASVYTKFAKSKIKENNYDEAIEALKNSIKAYTLAKKLNTNLDAFNDALKKNYDALIKLYVHQKEFEKILELYLNDAHNYDYFKSSMISQCRLNMSAAFIAYYKVLQKNSNDKPLNEKLTKLLSFMLQGYKSEEVFTAINKIGDKELQCRLLNNAFDNASPLGKWVEIAKVEKTEIEKHKKQYKDLSEPFRNVRNAARVFQEAIKQNNECRQNEIPDPENKEIVTIAEPVTTLQSASILSIFSKKEPVQTETQKSPKKPNMLYFIPEVILKAITYWLGVPNNIDREASEIIFKSFYRPPKPSIPKLMPNASENLSKKITRC